MLNMLMFHVDVNINWLGIRFKNDMIQSRCFLLRDNNFIGGFEMLKDDFIHLELCYTQNGGTLIM